MRIDNETVRATAEIGGQVVWLKDYKISGWQDYRVQVLRIMQFALRDFREEYEGADGIVIPHVAPAKV